MTRRTRSCQRRHFNALLIAVYVIIGIGVVCWVFNSRAQQRQEHSQRLDGLPTAEALYEVKMPEGTPHQLVTNKGMTLSFNERTHNPNYVAWELTRDEVGGLEERRSAFTHDDRVNGCAYTEDYRRSGFDRGHMMPAADAKSDPEMMEQTFMLTNICPQRHSLNGGSWKKLEEKCRLRVQRDSAIIIIAGPVPGDRITQYIGETGVAVPQRFFKVILAPYISTPYAIGFVMPNDRVPGGMQATAMSIDDVERITGYDFFSALPDSLEEALESYFSFNRFSRNQ